MQNRKNVQTEPCLRSKSVRSESHWTAQSMKGIVGKLEAAWRLHAVEQLRTRPARINQPYKEHRLLEQNLLQGALV